MKTLTVGIMPREQFQQRLLAIAAGDYRPAPTEPKVWFSSLKSLSEVLSENNLRLLKVLDEQKPETIKELAELTNRHMSNLSRTLKTMERYGIVELRKEGRCLVPIAKATGFTIQYGV
jgi:predicted transcriptional regulator